MSLQSSSRISPPFCCVYSDLNLENSIMSVALKLSEFSETHASKLPTLTPEIQNEILNLSISHPLSKSLPGPPSYSLLFAKTLYRVVEKQNVEVSDSLIEHILSGIDISKDSEKVGHKHYIVPVKNKESLNGTILNLLAIKISIYEDFALVTKGTTGLRTWGAALRTGDWIIQNELFNQIKFSFSGKKVLELGSGTGMLGLVLAAVGSDITLTDGDDGVMLRIQKNVELNIKNIQKVNGGKVFYRKLVWEEMDSISKEDFDIVIAADVVYDPSALSPFCNVLDRILGSKSKPNSQKFAILSSTIRNPETYCSMKELIMQYGMKFEVIDLSETPTYFLQSDIQLPIEILKIKK
ncbi:hypothetical protein HK096_000024 [Nowakowskiella sp. JEL0078]|nr:hypothetical protein HK096_000024 [Nowakowskiella sp. JEL0078]